MKEEKLNYYLDSPSDSLDAYARHIRRQQASLNELINGLDYILGDYKPCRRTRHNDLIKHIHVNEAKKTTVVMFKDGDKQIIHCHEEDPFDPLIGTAIALAYHTIGSRQGFKDYIKERMDYELPVGKPEPKPEPKPIARKHPNTKRK